MVHGDALIEMGKGSTSMRPFAWDNGIGGLSLMKSIPDELGRHDHIPEDWTPADSDVLITFDNPESVMGFIETLNEVLVLMKKARANITENTAEYPYTITREYHEDGNFTEYKED